MSNVTEENQPENAADPPAVDAETCDEVTEEHEETLVSEDTTPNASMPIPSDSTEAIPEPVDEHADEPEEGTYEVPDDLDERVEAALLTSPQVMNANRIGKALGGLPSKIIVEAIDRLNIVYAESNRSFRIEQVAGGWRIMTLPEYGDVLAGISKQRTTETKLRPPQLETLAIVAYKQPVTRVDVEMIRGVACGEVLRSLMERHLVKVVGRADEIGRPMLYGTTKKFLEVFGLNSTKDLPNVEEIGID
ncbi:Segregation and condensation protein B [Poriferisphaera corsica]|uniref:Segregation and condensation protein B n=1 Tax=Poriferisphaera corsica TaxID=2528020 RepID=A0A517YWA1_9BACT|nr:SMC-Scp complex subunit ScpB [Poriferisphaera corsica]QDU34514.1 Segregation and condensation protein B [Poriferisphaera corsica]